MSDDVKNEQTAVADTTNDDPNKGASPDSGAAQTDGLDELLAEFDKRREEPSKTDRSEQRQPPVTTEPGQGDKADIAALATLEQRLNEQEAREHQRELNNLYTRLSDGLQADAIDVEIFLGRLAKENPALNDLYANRHRDPGAWTRTEKALQQKVAQRFGKAVDKQVTESRDAASAAIRSASTAAPPKDLSDKEIASMSKDEFDSLQRKLGVTPA